jgi:hypothetical protein
MERGGLSLTTICVLLHERSEMWHPSKYEGHIELLIFTTYVQAIK